MGMPVSLSGRSRSLSGNQRYGHRLQDSERQIIIKKELYD
jgi:hypothetical protein